MSDPSTEALFNASIIPNTYPTIALGTPSQTNQPSSPIQTHIDISSPIRRTTQSPNAAFRAGDLNSLDDPFATQLSNAEFPAKSHRPFLQDRNNHNEHRRKDLHQPNYS
ncbi:hypothetical protein EAF00_007029 [Botryotinia globosa]|nr:hypothetical protein EAF00_007029 [Botryotinia globosa]